jgi:RNA polymerase sigma-70 factor, ECF subfamily
MREELAELYQKLRPTIHARCRRILGDDAEAEDAVQEVFLRVAVHLDDVSRSDEVLPWIYGIARNYCLNEIRNRRKRPQPREYSEQEVGNVSGETMVAVRDLVRKIGAHAPHHLANAAWLRHVEGMKHAEMGKALGVSRRTIINHLADFREWAAVFLTSER